MKEMTQLDLRQYADRLRPRTYGGKSQLWCAIRRKWVARTPEEIVRQLVIQALIAHHYPIGRMAVERQFCVAKRRKRFDLLVYDAHMQPWLLIECKAPTIQISQKVFQQAAWYNVALRAPWLLVSNGMQSWCAHIDHQNQSWYFTESVPPLL